VHAQCRGALSLYSERATAFSAHDERVTVLLSKLPAAPLVAARTPAHPFTLLIGLNLGPNLFATGSLAWLLWLQAARDTGAQPSIARASRVGAGAVRLSMAAALAVLAFTGSS
jgi:arsenical pump membrane protein